MTKKSKPGWFQRLRELPLRTPECLVIDDGGVTRIRGDGYRERVRWDEVVEVAICTNDRGPWDEDMYWMLCGADSGCAIANALALEHDLIDVLCRRFPGIDCEAMIHAASCSQDAWFSCWRRPELSA